MPIAPPQEIEYRSSIETVEVVQVGDLPKRVHIGPAPAAPWTRSRIRLRFRQDLSGLRPTVQA